MLSDVGRGMFAASLGSCVAADLGLGTAWAADEPDRLHFGDLEPLVAFMQETPPGRLLPEVVAKLRSGTDLKTLVSAAALANARAFGGEDYVGFHTLMALPPAYHMAAEAKDPLAVLKVLFRNSSRLTEAGKDHADTLRPVPPVALKDAPTGRHVRDAIRKKDLATAEALFATICRGAGDPANEALNELMVLVDDSVEVHRIVLVSRAWELLDFVGRDRAHTLLRQSVRFCADAESRPNVVKHSQEIRDLLPKLLDQYRLPGQGTGTRSADDAWVASFCETLLQASSAQAADAAAAALAEGMSPDAVGEAISLAANQLVLRDAGRKPEWASPGKPAGSVHGDSIGVHACDSVNAWRSIARAGNSLTAVTSLILAAYHVARDRSGRPEFPTWSPYPRPEHAEKVAGLPAESLLKELDSAIRDRDQARAAAITARLGAGDQDHARGVFALLRGHAVNQDGALHAEKYYRTASEEYAAMRPAFRWRQLVALARVIASGHGYPAAGLDEARKLLKA
jgi:hypothetical protein